MKKLLHAALLVALSLCAHAQSVLTLTANNYEMHQGDHVPTAYGTFEATGYQGTDTWTTAVSSGVPTFTTTATSSSAPGIYPLTISQGTMTATGSYTFNFVPGTLTVIPADGTGAQYITPVYGPNAMINALTQTLSAKIYGDGVTDDTAAINALFSQAAGTGPARIIRFPAAHYKITGRITDTRAYTFIFGDGPDKTVFEMAAASSICQAAGTSASPATAIWYQPTGGNEEFYNYLENVGVQIDPGNPYCHGIEYVASNTGRAFNDATWCMDSNCQDGWMEHQGYVGPMELRNISAYGFPTCIYWGSFLYNATAENITCQANSQYVMKNDASALPWQVRHLFSYNKTPVVTAGTSDVLLDSQLYCSGSTGATTAIQSGSGTGNIYVRNVGVGSCYINSLTDAASGTSVTLTQVANPTIAEYWTGTAQTLFDTGAIKGSLKLPITELPQPVDDPKPSNWCAAGPDLTTLPAELATCTSATFYFPVLHNYGTGNTTTTTNDLLGTGVYSVPGNTTINAYVPATVTHIQGNGFRMQGANTSILNLYVTTAGPDLYIDHAFFTNNSLNIIHTGTRRIILSDMGANYVPSQGAGIAFLEDFEPGVNQTFAPGQSVWAWQYDNEGDGPFCSPTTITVTGTTITLPWSGLNVISGYDCATFAVGTTVIIDLLKINSVNVLRGYYFRITSNTGYNGTAGTITGTLNAAPGDVSYTTGITGYVTIPNTKLSCFDCQIWMMGYKSEREDTLLNITDGKAEILGLIEDMLVPTLPGTPIVLSNDSSVYIVGGFNNYQSGSMPYWITETQGANTQSLGSAATSSGYVSLYGSNGRDLLVFVRHMFSSVISSISH